MHPVHQLRHRADRHPRHPALAGERHNGLINAELRRIDRAQAHLARAGGRACDIAGPEEWAAHIRRDVHDPRCAADQDWPRRRRGVRL
jgi:hypothetical protein